MAEENTENADHDAQIVALLTDHQSAIRYYVASLLPGEPSAADVAQHANATLWKKRADFTPGTNFKAWAFSVARYEVLNFRKTQARDARLGLTFSDELEDIIADEITDHADDLDGHQEALHACLQKLKPADRQLVQHRYFLRTPLKDVAEKTGRPVGSLKVTLHRIRNSLQRCIETNLQPS